MVRIYRQMLKSSTIVSLVDPSEDVPGAWSAVDTGEHPLLRTQRPWRPHGEPLHRTLRDSLQDSQCPLLQQRHHPLPDICL